MDRIRKARIDDCGRIAEIEVFNYRLNFYPIFQNDDFYFSELQVTRLIPKYEQSIDSIWVYDDGVVKGFVRVENRQIRKLFVEPALQGQSIGAALLEYAVTRLDATSLWALEKNVRAIAFYRRHGFHETGTRKPEEGTTEYLVELVRADRNSLLRDDLIR